MFLIYLSQYLSGMSERYKFVEGDAQFITFAVVGWVDVFTRREYAEFLLENLAYCRKNKGLRIRVFVIMPNHVRLIAAAANGSLGEIMRDFKTYTSKEKKHSRCHDRCAPPPPPPPQGAATRCPNDGPSLIERYHTRL